MSSHKRTSFQIMNDTVHALLMRELKTRFGSKKLGYFWAFVEPAAQASIMALLFTLIGRNSVSGVPVALFIMSGLLSYKFFSKLLPQLAASVNANKALFAYRQVTPIDPFITRFIIEIATFFIVYVVLMMIMAWLGFETWPQDILALITANILLALIASGIGLMLCTGMIYWEDTLKVLAMVMTPMFFISGIFFCATMIPQQYWYLFTWNPVFHVLELSRDALFYSYTTPVGSWSFIALIALITNALGLMMYQINRHRFVAS